MGAALTGKCRPRPEGCYITRTEIGSSVRESHGKRSGIVHLSRSFEGCAAPSAQNATAAVLGDRLYVKANIVLSEIGGRKVLGPLANLLSDRDSVTLGGTMNVIRQGLGQFVVQDVKIGSLAIPSALIPPLVGQIRRGTMPDGVAQNGFPMPLPNYISDIRIANGRITIYKNTP